MPGPLPRALRRATRSSGRLIPSPAATSTPASSRSTAGWWTPTRSAPRASMGWTCTWAPIRRTAPKLTGAQLGLSRTDPASIVANPDWTKPGFLINLPLDGLPTGPTVLTLAARTRDHGTWLSSLAVVVPSLGSIPPLASLVAQPASCYPHRRPYPPSAPKWRRRSQMTRSAARSSSRWSPPARTASTCISSRTGDNGGRLVGTSAVPPGTSASSPVKITVSAPLDNHTLYVHVASSASGQQQVLTVPILVRFLSVVPPRHLPLYGSRDAQSGRNGRIPQGGPRGARLRERRPPGIPTIVLSEIWATGPGDNTSSQETHCCAPPLSKPPYSLSCCPEIRRRGLATTRSPGGTPC